MTNILCYELQFLFHVFFFYQRIQRADKVNNHLELDFPGEKFPYRLHFFDCCTAPTPSTEESRTQSEECDSMAPTTFAQSAECCLQLAIKSASRALSHVLHGNMFQNAFVYARGCLCMFRSWSYFFLFVGRAAI